MRHLQAVFASVLLLLGRVELASAAAPQVVWSEEAETFATPGGLRFGAAVADDAGASGGKAVRIPHDAGANGWSVVFSAPRMEMRGQVLFTLWLRAENLPPLTPGFVLTLVAHDKQTGQWAHHRQTRVYGVNLPTQGYTPITLALDVPWTAETYGPEVILQWDTPPDGVAPVMYLDKAEIAVPVFDAPRVLDVSPTKIRYQPRELVTVLHGFGQPNGCNLRGDAGRRRDPRRRYAPGSLPRKPPAGRRGTPAGDVLVLAWSGRVRTRNPGAAARGGPRSCQRAGFLRGVDAPAVGRRRGQR